MGVKLSKKTDDEIIIMMQSMTINLYVTFHVKKLNTPRFWVDSNLKRDKIKW